MSIVINSPASSASVSGTVTVGFTVTNTYSATGGGSVTLSQSAQLSVNTLSLSNGAVTVKVEGAGQSATRVLLVNNTLAPSTSGATLPPASTLVDNAGGVWNIENTDDVYQTYGGTKRFRSPVGESLLFYDGRMYVKNTPAGDGHWYRSEHDSTATAAINGSGDPDWTELSSDPRSSITLSVPSSSATVSNPVSFSGTTNKGSVQIREGSTTLATVTPSGGNFSASLSLSAGVHTLVFSAGSATTSVAISRTFTVSAASATAGPTLGFYGINMHPDYTETGAQLANYCSITHCTTYRIDCDSDLSYRNAAAAKISATRAVNASISFLVVITEGPNWSASEAVNYSLGYAVAVTVATQMGPLGVTTYECGNELYSNYPQIKEGAGIPGDSEDDFVAGTPWRAVRGFQKGMIDGIHAVDPSYRAAAGFTVVEIGAADMLWNGREPDGTSGQAVVRWDVTVWHNYQVYGNLFDIFTSSHGSHFNAIEYMHNNYGGKPIMITEWNATSPTQTANASWITSFMTNMYAGRSAYNIESIIFYQVGGAWDQGQFGLLNSQVMTDAFVNFSSNNPA